MLQSKNATETNPNAVQTSVQNHGILFGVNYSMALGTEFQFESDLGVSLPFFYKEQFKNTGFYNSSQTFEFSASVAYRVSEIVSIAVAPFLRQERASFSGLGERGTTDAKESNTTIGVPFEFRLSF